MDAKSRVQVSEWRAEPNNFTHTQKTAFYAVPSGVIGVLGVALLHGALFLPLLNMGFAKVKMDANAGVDPHQLQYDALEATIIFVKSTPPGVLSDTAPMSFLSEDNALLHKAIEQESHANLRPLMLIPTQEPNSMPVPGSLAHAEAIYVKQITARIDRVWKRPRTSVSEKLSDESFVCTAQVVQDEAGNIHEVLLPVCNGTPSWQQSLLTAIRDASPLPAPPDPAAFRAVMTLNFIGLPFQVDSAADEYQPVNFGGVN